MMENLKTFRDLAGLNKLVESEEKETLTNREEYENIYVDITEDINKMKAYGKSLGLSNEQINPLVEALVNVDKIDDLIRANFTEEDTVENPEDDGQW